jgi:hypothetical protein
MAITADTNRKSAPDNVTGFPVPMATATTIPVGAIVSANAAGYAINATDTAGTRVLGIALSRGENPGADGAATVIVGRIYTVELTHAGGITAVSEGLPVYVVDNDVVALTSTNHIHVGFVAGRVSATKARIEVRPIPAIVAAGT